MLRIEPLWLEEDSSMSNEQVIIYTKQVVKEWEIVVYV